MMIARRLLAITLAAALPGFGVTPGHATLGMVTQAADANLSNDPVSAGTTVYDGDLLSTDDHGTLTFRGPAAILYLGCQSRMILHAAPDRVNGTVAHLNTGSLFFSTIQPRALEVHADEARIQPFADARTIGQVTITGPKMLYLYARQGSLVFSYRGESQVVAEGKSYRVLLDPPDDDSANKPRDSQPDAKPVRHNRKFLLVPLTVGFTAVVAKAIYDAVESPDHP